MYRGCFCHSANMDNTILNMHLALLSNVEYVSFWRQSTVCMFCHFVQRRKDSHSPIPVDSPGRADSAMSGTETSDSSSTPQVVWRFPRWCIGLVGTARATIQYQDCLSSYSVSHYKDKTVISYGENSINSHYKDKTIMSHETILSYGNYYEFPL